MKPRPWPSLSANGLTWCWWRGMRSTMAWSSCTRCVARLSIGSSRSVLSGVSHLLHARELNTLGTVLYKIRNVAGEVLHRLIDLNIVLPRGCRPDAIMVFLQPAQQPHP